MSYQQYQGYPPQGPGGPPPANSYGGPPPNQQPYYGQPGQYPPAVDHSGVYPPPASGAGASNSYYSQPPNEPAYLPPQNGQGPPPAGYDVSRAYPPGPPGPQGLQGHPYPSSQFPMNPQSYGQPPPPNQQYYGAASQQYNQPYGAVPPTNNVYGGPPPQTYPPQQYPPQQYPPQQYPPQQYPPQQYPPQQHTMAPYGMPGAYSAPSPGYEPNPRLTPEHYNQAAQELRNSMKGFGTRENELIRVLTQLDTPVAMLSTVEAFKRLFSRDLLHDIKKETSGHFEDGLLSLARGPLLADVHDIHSAIARPGTKESILNSTLLSRSNADLRAISQTYHAVYHKSLENEVRSDLSLKTEDMFDFILRANRNDDSQPIDYNKVDKDAYNLNFALEGGSFTVDVVTVYSTILQNNDAQIGAIATTYRTKYKKDLETLIAKKVSGHMKDALVYVIAGGKDRALRDAQGLEECMKGLGTKDTLLVHRLTKLFWNRPYFDTVRRMYARQYNKSLENAVRSETSGDYQKLMIAIITGGGRYKV